MLAYPFETGKDRTQSNDGLRQITRAWLCVRIATKLERLP
jgi:hypothetical protein